ncbi:NFYB/HAP3 family transcription factor subunit [Candidatus Woesearchaeota archaeon]|nr:NFYB/HAP3 family transcription factor subunit [Candidatus Woesearchaeota archaeon]
MPKRIGIIPRAPIGRILENAGARRVSMEAMEAFAQFLEDRGAEIAEKAVRIAKHSGRKTVHDGDVRLAVK